MRRSLSTNSVIRAIGVRDCYSIIGNCAGVRLGAPGAHPLWISGGVRACQRNVKSIGGSTALLFSGLPKFVFGFLDFVLISL